jgi:hypothetical protein
MGVYTFPTREQALANYDLEYRRDLETIKPPRNIRSRQRSARMVGRSIVAG